MRFKSKWFVECSLGATLLLFFYYNQDEKIPLAIENYNSKLERKDNNCKIADT